MEPCAEEDGLFYMGAQTVWLPADHFMNVDNWEDSLKPSASHYINQAEEWIASQEGSDITGVADFVNKEQKDATTSLSTTGPILSADVKKPFACSQCGKTFGKRSHLTEHCRIHSGEKPFSCIICGMTFTQRGHLTQHVRVHSAEKPFACSECGKSFTLRSHLTRHFRIHSGEKPLACSQCGKSFTQRTHLTQHNLVHSEERPFACSECAKTFKRKGDLKQHIHCMHSRLSLI